MSLSFISVRYCAPQDKCPCKHVLGQFNILILIIDYGSGWRKDVVKQRLEFVSGFALAISTEVVGCFSV